VVTGPRILHVSDLHLDAPTYRRTVNSTPGCWMRACEIAAEEAVDAIIVAGDVWHGRDPDRAALNAFQAGLDVAAAGRIPVLVIPGNHDGDPLAAPNTAALEPFGRQEGVHVSIEPEVVTVGDLRVATLPWVGKERLLAMRPDHSRSEGERAVMDGLLRILDGKLRPLSPDVLVGHWQVGGCVAGRTELDLSALGVPNLPGAELDGLGYVAFGHLHSHQELPGTWGYYSGSIDRVDFGEEHDRKVCLVVDLSGRMVAPMDLPARSLLTIEFVIEPSGPDYRGHEGNADGAICRLTGPNPGQGYVADMERVLRENGAAVVLQQLDAPERRIAPRAAVAVGDELSEASLFAFYCKRHERTDVAELRRMAETLPAVEEVAIGHGGPLIRRVAMNDFLSHHSTELDLWQVGSAAIVGPNGAGKSSILEAIAWAFWGEVAGRTDLDHQVHHEATLGRVTVELELAGHGYRVVRERAITGAGKSGLQLHVQADSIMVGRGEARWVGEWVPAAAGGIPEIQRAIDGLLGTYDAWCRTSFVPQGQALLFARSRASERRRFLVEILGADVYEPRAEAARKAARDAAEDVAGHVRRRELLDDEFRAEEAVSAGLASARESLERAEAAIHETAGAREEAEQAVGICQQDHARAAAAVATFQTRAAELRSAIAAVADEQRRVEASVSELERREERTAAELDRIGKLRDQVAADAARAEDLERRAGEAFAEAERCRKELDEALERFHVAEADVRAARARLEAPKRELAEVSDQLLRLGGGATGTCLRCGQEVTIEHLQSEQRRHVETVAAAEALIAELETVAGDLGAAVTDLRFRANTAPGEGHEARREALAIRERMAADGAVIEREPALWEDLRQAQGQVAEARVTVANLLDRTRALEADLAELREAGGGASAEREAAESLRQAETRLRLLREDERAANDRARAAAADVARFEARSEDLAAKRAERDAIGPRIEQATRESERWAFLANLYGRDGIQVLLIELAIPQVEEWANETLRSLSDGRFTLRLESLAALKSGGLREALEIIVTDGGVDRRFEALSGGEQVRVAFGLLLGIRRLLAARSGRPIQSLLLDEMFVELDPEGRDAAMSVLRHLAGDVALLLFVTHDPVMAGAFPHRIEVAQRDGSSVATVVGAPAREPEAVLA
jgi:DNA repair protein SbcC/Rad50